MRNAGSRSGIERSPASAAGKACHAEQLYRQMFNKELYLLAYGNIYSNKGAMTPGASEETADGMSGDKIDQITGLDPAPNGTGSHRLVVSTSRKRTGS